jgi:hypothetical protein
VEEAGFASGWPEQVNRSSFVCHEV